MTKSGSSEFHGSVLSSLTPGGLEAPREQATPFAGVAELPHARGGSGARQAHGVINRA